MIRKIAILGIALAALVLRASIGAPPARGDVLTLMQALAGASYERRAYDRAGKLQQRQVLTLGALEPDPSDPDFLAMPVTVTTYDLDGGPEKTAQATWRCDADPAAMLMFAAIRSGPPRDIDITIEAKGSAILYRKDIVRRTALEDIVVTLKVTSGVLGLLGTRTKLSFSDRVAEPLDAGDAGAGVGARDAGDTSDPGNAGNSADLGDAGHEPLELHGAYRIRSTLLARTLVLGIPIRRTHLDSDEWIDPGRGLIRHELRMNDGRKSIAERLTRAGAASEPATARSPARTIEQ